MPLIFTTKGYMEECDLVKGGSVVDNENEHTVATEYYLGGELVHRSVHVTLKKAAVFAESAAGSF